jgi:tyrosyl-tRNA synthetase
MNFVEELKWRGMLQDIMPGTEEQLLKEMTSGYIGFDPTSDSLGIGNMVPVMLLMHFQAAGHKPFALVGGATGMIGDPSGKSAERNLLSEEILRRNVEGQRKQLEKFLNFDCGANSAEIVNNYDWFKDMSFLQFLRDVGKHLTVSYMMAKDSVQNRLETGLSFTEFSYQLVQGYDFFHLHSNQNIKLQMGGSDQWGNIVTGTELIRRKSGGQAYALTAPLITKADGSKFGKSESGNIWLDPKKTSPYEFYQYWLQTSDADAERYIKIFTMLNRETIEKLVEEHKLSPHLRTLQKTLAKDITVRVHSEKDFEEALEASEVLFGKMTAETMKTFNRTLLFSVFNTLKKFDVPRTELEAGINVVELLSDKTGLFKSRGEARKMIQGGGVRVNKEKIENPELVVNGDFLLYNEHILVQKGKTEYNVLQAV